MTPTKATRRQLLQSGSLVLLLGVRQIARGAEILAVRVWPAKDYTRLTIESDSEIKARHSDDGSKCCTKCVLSKDCALG